MKIVSNYYDSNIMWPKLYQKIQFVVVLCFLIFLSLLLPKNNNYSFKTDKAINRDILGNYKLPQDVDPREQYEVNHLHRDVKYGAENAKLMDMSTSNLSDKPKEIPIILLYEQHPFFWFSPFKYDTSCPNHCIFTNDSRLYTESKAVIFFRSLRKPPPKKLPKQRWIYFTNESPAHIGPISSSKVWRKSATKFDWLLSYRPGSDFVFPFGVLEKMAKPESFNYTSIFSKKEKNVAWLVSHCQTDSKREAYVRELKKYIDVDVFGKCGDKKCPTEINKPEDFTGCKSIISQTYKFYLSFENSLCKSYVTEKVFGVYENDNMMVPVVRSAPNVASYLPEGSYIPTTNFESPKELAEFLKLVGSSEENYTNFLRKKHSYKLTPWTDNYKRAICKLCTKITYDQGDTDSTNNGLFYKLGRDKCHPPGDIHW